ncbi:hypothetical protein HID58_068577, partial [Brassica napus]
ERERETASQQLLWDTGMLCEPISNGFYSVVPDKRVKELYNRLPTPNELHALGEEGVRIEVSDFYKRPTLESPSKLALEENAFLFENVMYEARRPPIVYQYRRRGPSQRKGGNARVIDSEKI